MPTLILELMANYFNIEKSDLIEKHTEDEKLPTNAILPSVHSVPVMGTICAGTGRICEDDYQGHFVNLNCIS